MGRAAFRRCRMATKNAALLLQSDEPAARPTALKDQRQRLSKGGEGDKRDDKCQAGVQR
jgi:hypothetical protein